MYFFVIHAKCLIALDYFAPCAPHFAVNHYAAIHAGKIKNKLLTLHIEMKKKNILNTGLNRTKEWNTAQNLMVPTYLGAPHHRDRHPSGGIDPTTINHQSHCA